VLISNILRNSTESDTIIMSASTSDPKFKAFSPSGMKPTQIGKETVALYDGNIADAKVSQAEKTYGLRANILSLEAASAITYIK
jgi:hypothetical protein